MNVAEITDPDGTKTWILLKYDDIAGAAMVGEWVQEQKEIDIAFDIDSKWKFYPWGAAEEIPTQ